MVISVGYSWSYRTFLTINTFIRTLMTTWQNIFTYIFTFVIFNRIITLIKLRNRQIKQNYYNDKNDLYSKIIYLHS